ncbi:hypothetical protein AB6802_09540 [Mesorhizobium sp. RCC_202]|uniref:hypothetical protein n=1 Tax=Mesorhizobium sp. RCC_202 TaxID=3239222 RepID=UPI0035234B39
MTILLLVLVAAMPASANETTHLENRIGDCLRLPAAAIDNRVKVVFEVTLDESGKVKSVAVTSYEPHSTAAAQAAQQLTGSVRKCWPPGVKTSPMRLVVDLRGL